MKDVFIIGCKGIPANYGGYETFVENLTKRKINKDIKYHVGCIGDVDKEYEYNNAHCFQLKIPNLGPAKALVADIIFLKHAIKYVKKNKIKNFTVLILACRIGIVFKRYVKKIHRLGGKVVINPDGHEWKRSKWSKPIKMYWKYSEKKMVRYADLVICDSINIQKYILEEYRKYSPKTKFIAYGTDVEESTEKLEECEWVMEWMNKFDISPQKYFLIVGRFVPENNYETMIREYMRTELKKDLVIITNYEENKYYKYLKNKLHFEKDKRIKFVGTVYNEKYIKLIRESAYGYLHGHSVGGTNPSLLEALSTTKINLLFDCSFNREVAEDNAYYFSLSDGDLKSLLEKVNVLTEELIEKKSFANRVRMKECYSWDLICTAYEKEVM